jgi:hypothetical protein
LVLFGDSPEEDGVSWRGKQQDRES